jgi:hypothetical protein
MKDKIIKMAKMSCQGNTLQIFLDIGIIRVEVVSFERAGAISALTLKGALETVEAVVFCTCRLYFCS